jgi:K+/H+ antiporter YhaU regulatory subunit KhtT
VKERGLRVMRAVITKTSSLIGKAASDVDFRRSYKAAVVAIQKGGKNVAISSFVFGPGDVLVLQVEEDSPLLKVPPPSFYKRISEHKDAATLSRASSVASFVNKFAKSVSRMSTENLESMGKPKIVEFDEELANENSEDKQEIKNNEPDDEGFFIEGAESDDDNKILHGEPMLADMVSSMQEVNSDEEVWRDLQVAFMNEDQAVAEGGGTREFLTAMQIAPKSKLAKRTVAETGLDKLPGVFLVSIDRPTSKQQSTEKKPKVTLISPDSVRDDRSEITSLPTVDQIFTTISPDTLLAEGDVLWFAGSASAVGDLRKVPGLISYESEEVEKINEKVHDRRLVEAVIARRGPLVGKTVKEVRFRTRFGAAVIAVHRDGARVHDHPGKIKLQAGDVLLLEAGPTFIKKSIDNDRSFALLAMVEDSAPPRLTLLIPALVITAAMLTVFTAGVASLLVCALVASILMVCLGILSEQEARDAINWDVFITIAAAFGIGIALVNSGVAGGVANFLVDVGEAVGMGGE